MASLIEELVSVLENENTHYEELMEIAKDKTNIIVQGDLANLQEVTSKEQSIVDKITSLEKKRLEVIKDIATVVNTEPESITIKEVVEMLKGRPEEQNKLALIHDRLQKTLNYLASINEMNQNLIQESLEMVNFNINLINSIRQAPETANYTKGAYTKGSMGNLGAFEAKQ